MSLSSCVPDYFVWVKDLSSYRWRIPDPTEVVTDLMVDMLPDELAKDLREKLKKERAEKSRKEREEAAKKAREEEEKARKEQREIEELTLLYVKWRSRWENDVDLHKLITIFPHIPRQVCKCIETSCVSSKEEGGTLGGEPATS